MGYTKRGLPLVWLFVDYEDPNYRTYVNMLKEAGSMVVDDFGRYNASIVHASGVEQKQFLEHLGATDVPGLVVIDDRGSVSGSLNPKKYKFQWEFTQNNVNTFLREWMDGSLPAYYKSAPEPKNRAEAFDKGVHVTVA